MAVDLSHVTSLLLDASADYLLNFCETHRIVVPAAKRESKPALFKLVMRFLNSVQVEESEDGGKAIVDKVVEELTKEENQTLPGLEDGNQT